MDTAQWPQGIIINNGGAGVVYDEKHIVETKEGISSGQQQQQQQVVGEKRGQAAGKEEALKCPRCNSCNTKFCYYNNYSLTQPRYFCKTCRRYWTQGGTLRTVPVGGGSRKNKRPSSSSSSNYYNNSSLSSKKQVITLPPPPPPPLNLLSINEETSYLFQNPSFASSELSLGCSYVPTTAPELTNNNMFSSLFPFQEFKPTLNYFSYHNNIHHGHLITANNGVHQQTPAAKLDGFDQINQAQADRDSIGLLNNGMLTGGGVWQL